MVGISMLIAAGFAASQTPAQTAQVPAGPPGGVNAARLPDTDGVRLGMTVNQATAVMRTLFPGSDLQILYSRYPKGPSWVSTLRGSLPDHSDNIDVSFSMPPNPQQVLAVKRVVVLAPGKQPTLDNTLASLRQKYGKELPPKKRGDTGVLAWAYDEQGQPTVPQGPENWSPADCAGQTMGTSGGQPDAALALDIDSMLDPTPLAQQLPALTGNLCNRSVYVSVQLFERTIQATPVVYQFYVLLGEKPLMLRDAIAVRQYLDGQAAAKQQQQRKSSEQVKAPGL
jgi:hypothetical protein